MIHPTKSRFFPVNPPLLGCLSFLFELRRLPPMTTLFISIHIISAVLWVGGMFFSLLVLRPTAVELFDPPNRLNLWRSVFTRFFPWVWGFVIALPVSGYAFMAQFGFDSFGYHVKIMQVLGFIMIFVYLHVFFAPYKRLRRFLDGGQIQEAAKQLNQIRILITVNLVLGLIVIIVGASGRYWAL